MHHHPGHRCKTYISTILLCCAACAAHHVFANDVFIIASQETSSQEMARITLACRFYGLEATTIIWPDTRIHIPQPADGQKQAVIIDAALLKTVDQHYFKHANILIFDTTTDSDLVALRTWTEDIITGCRKVGNTPATGDVSVINDRDIAFELSGTRLPFKIDEGYQLQTHNEHKSNVLMTYNIDGKSAVTFVRTHMNDNWLYIQTRIKTTPPADAHILFFNWGQFSSIAPYMLFLRNTFKDQCWHAPRDMANLTIDDPWLREPYGTLNYHDLSKEMEKANFHTTIAFVPWNFDRKSDPEVVALFKSKPEQFSLCMHGDNHDHREFYYYTNHPDCKWPAKSLKEQDASIRQGLARLDYFTNQTGLTYDKIMVFPHLISPGPTLNVLKKYNFMATCNAGHVPLNEPKPTDPLFWLRRATSQFEGFASMDRTEPRHRTKADIATDLFLDNPVLYVVHLGFFRKGIDAFNETAQAVNELQPETKWSSLGTVARHLYRQRLRPDSDFDIETLSPDIILYNTSHQDKQFYISKPDNKSVPIKTVTWNDQAHRFTQDAQGNIHVIISIPALETGHVVIQYQNDFIPENESLEKNDIRVNTLRRLAAFRDLYLSGGVIGWLINKLYYKTGIYLLGLKAVTAVFCLGILLLITAFVIIMKKRQQKGRASNNVG